ncbi:MAG TPA: P1 family peptidase, partial [Chloroflexota bacterium]|nr:P1 family peptidase [Chloroflexota bacterium]
NAVGSVHDPATSAVLARPRATEGSGPLVFTGGNTTLAVVATTAPLGKAAATRLAMVAHDGLALAIRPAHTAYDGDTVFALSLPPPDATPVVESVTLDAAAGEVVAAAIVRAVRLATGLHGVPAAGERPEPRAGTG